MMPLTGSVPYVAGILVIIGGNKMELALFIVLALIIGFVGWVISL